MSTFEVWKAIWEVRYPAAGLLFDNRGKLADHWYQQDGFTNWSIANNRVMLHNEDKSTILAIAYRNTIFTVEKPEMNEFCRKAARYTNWVLNTLKVRRLERMGFRIYQAAERSSFENVYNSMMSKFFSLSDEDWAVFGGKPLDIGFPLTLQLGDSKANFKMGPMTKADLAERLESGTYKDELPEASLFIDFDVYQNNPEFRARNFLSELETFLNDSGKRIQEMSNSILRHFGGFQ